MFLNSIKISYKGWWWLFTKCKSISTSSTKMVSRKVLCMKYKHLNGVKMSLDFGPVKNMHKDTMISSQEPAKEKRDNDDSHND
jgi:hypothetical protein